MTKPKNSPEPRKTEPKRIEELKAHEKEIDPTLGLFLSNLELIRKWYDGKPVRGVELGSNEVGSIATSNIIAALAAALQGRAWVAPV